MHKLAELSDGAKFISPFLAGRRCSKSCHSCSGTRSRGDSAPYRGYIPEPAPRAGDTSPLLPAGERGGDSGGRVGVLRKRGIQKLLSIHGSTDK